MCCCCFHSICCMRINISLDTFVRTLQPGSQTTVGRPHILPTAVHALGFYREKGSALPFPRRRWSRILCTHDKLWVSIPVRVTAARIRAQFPTSDGFGYQLKGCFIKFVGRTSRGHTGFFIYFCGACLNFSCEKDSAIPFPRRPWSRILCTNDLIVLHLLGIFIFIPLISAVHALIFLARRIQPFLSLVDREVEFCVLTI